MGYANCLSRLHHVIALDEVENLTLQVPRSTEINFLETISMHYPEECL